MEHAKLLTLTADIVSAYVGNNAARTAELPDLIASVHKSLVGVITPQLVEAPAAPLTPAVPVKKSITDDFMICLDDGKKFKSLKRHLTQLGMTPDEYRAKWGLPRDYPMVAPGYALKRSELAKLSGLGNTRRGTAVSADVEGPSTEMDEPLQAEKAAPTPAVEEIEPDMVAEGPNEPQAPVEAEAPKRRGRPKKAA